MKLDPFVRLLLAIDAGPYHARATYSLSGSQRSRVRVLIARGEVRRLPRKGRMPPRFVVTSRGSHMLGTFALDTLWEERRAA